MGNEVIVTRAPRLNKCSFLEVSSGLYLTNILGNEGWFGIYSYPAKIGEYFQLPYHLTLGEEETIPFESFEAMCKWVAGGRKLEDLQGDTRSEWVRIGKLKIGQHAELVSYHQASRFVGEVILVAIGCSMNVLTGEISDIPTTVVSEDELGAWYWPVRLDLGDKIEIKAKENGSTKE